MAKDRLPIFRSDKIKEIVARAFDEARNSGGILIVAYVIMADHAHVVSQSERGTAEIVRFLNGISAKRVIDHLKLHGHTSSLMKLRTEAKQRNYRHSVWQHHPDTFEIFGEDTLRQKVNYIHQNPVRAGLVQRAEDYLYSSARIWNECQLENEPLSMDLDQIDWW